jgi:hypothetical protein
VILFCFATQSLLDWTQGCWWCESPTDPKASSTHGNMHAQKNISRGICCKRTALSAPRTLWCSGACQGATAVVARPHWRASCSTSSSTATTTVEQVEPRGLIAPTTLALCHAAGRGLNRPCCCALQERVAASSSHAEQASQERDEEKQQLKLRVQVIPSINNVKLTPAASRSWWCPCNSGPAQASFCCARMHGLSY